MAVRAVVGGGGGALSISAGGNSAALGSVVFSNSNGVSFGLNGSTLTASVAAAAGAQTGISGIVVSNTTYTSGTVSFSNANGLSFGSSAGQAITGSYTVPSIAGLISAVNLSAGTTSNNLTAAVLSNSNNVSFGLAGSTITGSASFAAQTNPGFSAQGGSSSFQTLIFTNSNNVSFSNTGGSVWGSYALNVSATGGTSNALSGLTFRDSNGISFGLSTGVGVGTLTGTVATTYRASNDAVGTNTAQTNVTWTVNSSGISLNAAGYAGTGFTSGSTSGAWTATLNTAGLSEVMPYLTRLIWPNGNLTAITAPGNATESIQYVPVQQQLTGTRIDALLAMSNSSSAGAGTVTLQFSQYAIIYTRNASTLSSLSSGSTQTTYTYASNTAGATYLTNSAIYPISVPVNFNMPPGEYFVGFAFVTSTTAVSVTMSMMGGNQIATANNYAEFANTATSQNLYRGMGIYSAATTGVVAGVSLSAINQTGSALSAANIALVFRNG